MKDVWWGHGDGTVGVFGGHTSFGDAAPLLGLPLARPRRRQVRGDHRRAERRRLPGPAERRVGGRAHGSRARRHRGARRSCKRLDFAPSNVAFDAAFDRDEQCSERPRPSATAWSAAGATPSSARCTGPRPRSTGRRCWSPARCRPTRTAPAIRRATWASPTIAPTARGGSCSTASSRGPRTTASTSS